MKGVLTQLESQFLTYKRLTLLQVELTAHAESGFVITNQKGKLKIEYYFSSLNELKEIDYSPVVMLFKGKGILHKKVSSTQVQEDDFLGREFPNIQPEDFFIEFQEAEKSAMVSLCRKNIVLTKVSELTKFGLEVVDVFINPLHFSPVALLIQKKQFHSEGNSIIVNDNSFIDFFSEPETVNEEQVLGNVPNEFLALYGVALSKILHLTNFIKIGFSDFSKKEEDILYKKIVSVSYKVVPGALLLILIINLLVFQSLFSTKNELDNSIGYYRNISGENIQLIEEINKKTNFLAISGWDQKSEVSKVLDQVASTVPEEIHLTQLNYYPLDEKEYNDKEVFVFDNSRILMKGATGKVKYLNNWVSLLKEEEWFNEIEILDYSFNKEENIGEFILEVRFE